MKRARAALIVVALASACGPRETPVEYVDFLEVADGGGKGAFMLTTTVVTTFENNFGNTDSLYSPNVRNLRGDHVLVSGGGAVGVDVCSSVDTSDVKREQWYEANTFAAPSFVNIQYNRGPLDGRVIPADHDSLFLLSAYVHFDRVRQFFADLGDRSRAVTTPVRVYFETETAAGCGPFNVPIMFSDNALYLLTVDAFQLLRNTLTLPGVEFGVNPGIVAHEFGHRVFTHNLFSNDDTFRSLVKGDDAPCTDDTVADAVDDCENTGMLQRAMSEGFADIAGFTYSGKSDLLLSYSIPTLVESRTLQTTSSPGTALVFYSTEVAAETVSSAAFDPYALGTLFARGFYAGLIDPDNGSRPDDDKALAELSRKHHLPAMLRALERTSNDLAGNYRLDPRHIIRRFLEEVARRPDGTYSTWTQSAMCQAMCDRFGISTFTTTIGETQQVCPSTIGTNTAVASSFQCTL